MKQLLKGLRQGEFKVIIDNRRFINSTFMGKASYIYYDNKYLQICIDGENSVCMIFKKEDLRKMLLEGEKGSD